jgi:EAL domain-containing protein (putative c-di-GMP-specific phosphodiesterase class I)
MEAEEEKDKTNLEKSKELRPWLLRAKSIPLNTWLRFQKDGEQEPQFIRLVWIARAYTKFVFVNHQGLKVIELGAFKFAEYLKRGQITPDPEFNQPIVKQGLDDMVKEVYEKLAFDSSHDKQSGLPNAREFQRLVRAVMKKGERTQQCCLYYIRALSGELSEEHEALVVESLSELLKIKRKEVSIASRVNRYDFVLFVTGVTVANVIEDFASGVSDALSGLRSKGIEISFMRSEIWGYLGFNNEAALVKNAKESLSQMESERGAGSQEQSSRIELQAKSTESVGVGFSSSDSEAFAVYVQEVRKLSRTDLPQNLDLKCKRGETEGTFFEPETEEEARELNSWWLGFAARSLTTIHDEMAYRIPLSAISLTDDAFKEEFQSLLDCTDMPPERIWFDLYNCSLLDNEHFAASVIRELQIYGCHFSLQGYGTSDCPARLLQTLPVDLITIDAEVFKVVNEESEEEPLVNVAHHFDKAVLVRNVDSAIMLQKIEKQGVDFIQGERIGTYRPY